MSNLIPEFIFFIICILFIVCTFIVVPILMLFMKKKREKLSDAFVFMCFISFCLLTLGILPSIHYFDTHDRDIALFEQLSHKESIANDYFAFRAIIGTDETIVVHIPN